MKRPLIVLMVVIVLYGCATTPSELVLQQQQVIPVDANPVPTDHSVVAEPWMTAAFTVGERLVLFRLPDNVWSLWEQREFPEEGIPAHTKTGEEIVIRPHAARIIAVNGNSGQGPFLAAHLGNGRFAVFLPAHLAVHGTVLHLLSNDGDRAIRIPFRREMDQSDVNRSNVFAYIYATFPLEKEVDGVRIRAMPEAQRYADIFSGGTFAGRLAVANAHLSLADIGTGLFFRFLTIPNALNPQGNVFGNPYGGSTKPEVLGGK